MSFAFCFTEVGVLASIFSTFAVGLSAGGPAVMSWGWIITCVFTWIIGASMAEICSTYPSAGSVYHWAGMMAPARFAPLLAYTTGWFNFIGNSAGDAVFAFGFSQAVTAAYEVAVCPLDPRLLYLAAADLPIAQSSTTSSASFVPGPTNCKLSMGAQVGIAQAVTVLWSVLNFARVDQQGWVCNLGALWQVVTVFVIVGIIVQNMVSSGHRASSHYVWSHYENNTGLLDSGNGGGNMGYVILVGLLYSCFCFTGYEAGAHMAEETRNARRTAPMGLMATVLATGAVGLILTVGLLYAIPPELGIAGISTSGVIATHAAYMFNGTNTHVPSNPVSAILTIATGSVTGLALNILIVIMLFFSGLSSLSVTTRITFAMARDGAFPGSQSLIQINPYTKSPVRSVLLVCVFDLLLLLLPLEALGDSSASATAAWNAVTGIATIGFQVSYLIPIWMRCTVRRKDFERNAFNLGVLGVPAALIAALWLTITSLFFFWPSVFPVDKANMNYSVVVVAGFAFIALVHWIVWARWHYQGPYRADVAKLMEAKRDQRSLRQAEGSSTAAELAVAA